MGSPSPHPIYTNQVTTRRIFFSAAKEEAAPDLRRRSIQLVIAL